MPTITDEELEEYQHLKSVYTREMIQKSLDSVTTLEEDIDAPIRNCIAAFALLGCKPIWSCCGFNYIGQPLHKKHQIGRCYFILDGRASASVILTIGLGQMPYKRHWEMSFNPETVDLHLDFKNVIDKWDDANCIHYAEQATIYIGFLEEYLMALSDNFKDIVAVTDGNHMYDNIPSWQYKPKQEWVITKEDLIARYNAGKKVAMP